MDPKLIEQVEQLRSSGLRFTKTSGSHQFENPGCRCLFCCDNEKVNFTADEVISKIKTLKELIDKVFEAEKRPEHDQWCGDGAMCCTCNFSEHRKHIEDLRKRIGELL